MWLLRERERLSDFRVKKTYIELIALYVHPKISNHRRSHLRAIMALDYLTISSHVSLRNCFIIVIVAAQRNSRIHHFLTECTTFNQIGLRHFLPECIARRTSQINTRGSPVGESVHPSVSILGDPGAVSPVGRKGGTNVFKCGQKSS